MNRRIERYLRIKHFFWYNLLFWVFALLLETVQIYSFTNSFGFEFDPSLLIRWPVSIYLTYWILSLGVISIFTTTVGWKKLPFITFHLFASILFGWLHKLLAPIIGLLLERLFYVQETLTIQQLPAFWSESPFDFLSGTFIYILLILILLAINYYQRFQEQLSKSLELESKLSTAKLNQMKMQLHPHFLFNAFNTISMMVRQKKNDDAVHMISDLSDMFRHSLSKESRQFVTLEEEIELVKKYLSIESYRYRDRLTIEWNLDPSLASQQIPSLILQPIVENAFKHGISKTLDNAALKISCYQKDKALILEVFNSGPALPASWEFQKTKGIGLSNTSDRLSRLYQNNYKFLISEQEDGLLVRIHLPLNN